MPWSCGFTKEARAKLEEHFKPLDVEDALQNHLLKLGSDIGFFTDLGEDHVQDIFGVVWDRSIDKDIGNVSGCVLSEPTLGYIHFPIRLTAGFLQIFPATSPVTGIVSGFSRLVSPYTNAPGLCGACRTC